MSRLRTLLAAALCTAAAGTIAAEEIQLPPEYTAADGSPLFPEGTPLPRHETEWERAWVESQLGALPATPRASAPPTGPVHCTAEYEPTEGIILTWEGTGGETPTGSILTMMRTMIQQITTTGAAKVYLSVDSAAEQTAATTSLSSVGIDMSKVDFIIRTTDSIWMCDFGPRYIYEGDVRATVDHVYNRPARVNDNTFPIAFAAKKKHTNYLIDLVHGGGNFALDAVGRGYATRLIVNENTSLTEAQINAVWATYQGLSMTLFNPFPTSVDTTQHLDMWMSIIGDDKVIISDWPNNVGSTQDNICDAAAIAMATAGYTVTRVPARSIGGTHYTYTNVVQCNNLVLLPMYTNSTIVAAGHNDQALAAWQSALPGKTIVQVDCQSIVTLSGVMHCIIRNVPVNRNGANPGVYVRSFNTGGTVTAGNTTTIQWSSDDDFAGDAVKGVQNVDILLSTDGGATWPTTIASAVPDTGTYNWTVNNLPTTQARIRVVARDGDSNTGFDDNDMNFTINAPSGVGDWPLH